MDKRITEPFIESIGFRKNKNMWEYKGVFLSFKKSYWLAENRFDRNSKELRYEADLSKYYLQVTKFDLPKLMLKKEVIEYCYLAYDGRHYKIGKSNNPKKRVLSMRTGNPSIELLKYSAKVEEKDLHHQFKSKQVILEWFNLDESDLEVIYDLMENGAPCPF